jgi:hypothetical protein
MKGRISLDELEARLKQMSKPTPFQVIDLITQMYKELSEKGE